MTICQPLLTRNCDSVGARTQDLLLRRQLLYPAELPNQPCSDILHRKSAAKVGIFSETTKFLDGKSDIGAIIERIIASDEGFRRLELADVERGVLLLCCQPLFRFGKCGTEPRIAVGCKDQLPGPEVERIDRHELFGDGEAVDYGKRDVLLLHRLK